MPSASAGAEQVAAPARGARGPGRPGSPTSSGGPGRRAMPSSRLHPPVQRLGHALRRRDREAVREVRLGVLPGGVQRVDVLLRLAADGHDLERDDVALVVVDRAEVVGDAQPVVPLLARERRAGRARPRRPRRRSPAPRRRRRSGSSRSTPRGTSQPSLDALAPACAGGAARSRSRTSSSNSSPRAFLRAPARLVERLQVHAGPDGVDRDVVRHAGAEERRRRHGQRAAGRRAGPARRRAATARRPRHLGAGTRRPPAGARRAARPCRSGVRSSSIVSSPSNASLQ